MTTETSTEATQGDENTTQEPQVTPQQSERDRITANYEKNLLNEIKPVETDTNGQHIVTGKQIGRAHV